MSTKKVAPAASPGISHKEIREKITEVREKKTKEGPEGHDPPRVPILNTTTRKPKNRDGPYTENLTEVPDRPHKEGH